jgi:lambda family phage portal protein
VRNEQAEVDALMSKLDRLGTLSTEELHPPAPARRKTHAVRQYAAAQQDRLTAGWSVTTGSADIELQQGLSTLRARSRALIRDSSYAKRAKTVVVSNVIGQGIGLQAQVYSARGQLHTRVNSDIETAWKRWCRADSCHTGGRLSFSAFERACIGQVFAAGEVFIRKHRSKFGSSKVPYALELIESERVPDGYQFPEGHGQVRMGIEVDKFHRPIAYWIRENHPGEARYGIDASERIERVPAEDIIHLAIVDRWPQTRGEPWMHTAARRLNDMDGYSEAEIIRARGQAVRMGIIETNADPAEFGEEQEDGSYVIDMEPGQVARLSSGETWKDSNPTAPNPQLDPFMRYMLREVAAGVGVSYHSISCDFSDANYSSSRLALLEDRDMWRVLQTWFIESFREVVHREWLQQAVFAGALQTISVNEYAMDVEKFEAVRFRPRGWGWVDPTKEVAAFKAARRAGFMSSQAIVSTSGEDYEELIDQLKHENDLADAAGLVLDTNPAQTNGSGQSQSMPGAADPEDPEDTEAPPGGGQENVETGSPQKRASSFLRAVE